MKTMLLAAAVVLTFGAGAAYAGDGEGPVANSQFTEIPSVIAQAPGYNSNSAYASTQKGGNAVGSTSVFVTQQHQVSAFPWNPNEGVGG